MARNREGNGMRQYKTLVFPAGFQTAFCVCEVKLSKTPAALCINYL
jgi:hypothetical protein